MAGTISMSRRGLIGAAAMVPVAAVAKPEPRRLEVGDPLPRFGLLKPGARHYLRSIDRGAARIALDIWRREVRFETVDGVQRLRIVQRWDGTGAKPSLVTRDSLFEPGSWRPSSHIRITTAEDKRMVEGFLFEPSRIVGLVDLADNSRADFAVASPEPMYNFETDMEMLGTLPLGHGYAVSIPFYHPAGGAPARYLWTVTGDEKIAGPDGRAIDCWIVECDYNTTTDRSRFWFAKTTQQFVKLEAKLADGSVLRKTLLY